MKTRTERGERTPAAALVGLIVGFPSTLVWKLRIRGAIQEAGGPDVYELVPAFFLSLLAAVVFSFLVPRTQGAPRK